MTVTSHEWYRGGVTGAGEGGGGGRGRRGHDDEEESGMTLDEYEAIQRKPKPVMPAAHLLGMKLTCDKQSFSNCIDSCLILSQQEEVPLLRCCCCTTLHW